MTLAVALSAIARLASAPTTPMCVSGSRYETMNARTVAITSGQPRMAAAAATEVVPPALASVLSCGFLVPCFALAGAGVAAAAATATAPMFFCTRVLADEGRCLGGGGGSAVSAVTRGGRGRVRGSCTRWQGGLGVDTRLNDYSLLFRVFS